MSVPKTSSLQAYAMLVYRKAVHPEFFQIEGRRRLEHPQYEFEGWVFKGGHAGRFQFGELCVCEVVVEGGQNLPEKGLVATMPCAGEREFEEKFGDGLKYLTTLQTETLSEHLYTGTYREMLSHARDRNCISTQWTDAQGRPNLSLLDVQRYLNAVHIQGYHLRSDCGMVLRTQSMFEMNEVKKPRSGKA
jgi:hypothetical protein